MKLKSLIENAQRLEVAEVEIEFIPGIPQIHFLGLPDRLIKESFYRIKSALKSSGYEFPLTSQMVVNIKPQHLRKSSRGLELAVALGILLKSGQIESDRLNSEWIIYGELGLDGEVYEPSDLAGGAVGLSEERVLTGQGKAARGLLYRLKNLREMEITREECAAIPVRPTEGLERFYSEDEAEFLFLTVSSGLHALLAGDSGAGKSTLAFSLPSFLPEPEEGAAGWRPLIAPHPSLTSAAFLGGGERLYAGEMERAQGGVLLLDEFLQYDAGLLEALRGPMNGEPLRLARGGGVREVNPDFQVVATTNLCPCGKWTPLKTRMSCRFSRLRCTRYLERLSGPVLDRFGLLFFTSAAQTARKIPGVVVLERLERLRKAGDAGGKGSGLSESYYRSLSSRRRNYLERAARVYAQERRIAQGSGLGATEVALEDYSRAERWVITPFEQLERGMS